MRAPQFFRINIGHQVAGIYPWRLQISRNQLRAGAVFRRPVRSLSLRPSWLLAPGLMRSDNILLPFLPGLSHPGFQVAGTPRTPAGYNYGVIQNTTPAGLSPASTAACLAALPHFGFRLTKYRQQERGWNRIDRSPEIAEPPSRPCEKTSLQPWTRVQRSFAPATACSGCGSSGARRGRLCATQPVAWAGWHAAF